MPSRRAPTLPAGAALRGQAEFTLHGDPGLAGSGELDPLHFARRPRRIARSGPRWSAPPGPGRCCSSRDRDRPGSELVGMDHALSRLMKSCPFEDRMKLSASRRRPSSLRAMRGSSARMLPDPVRRRLAPPSPASRVMLSRSTEGAMGLEPGIDRHRDRDACGRHLRRRPEQHLGLAGQARRF